ncbi:MAG: DNRLRE domain-containing protein [Myxococcaceae bacterium]|nr:DNRLRE domain-containing protein [Myxococcaceae bacterium]
MSSNPSALLLSLLALAPLSAAAQTTVTLTATADTTLDSRAGAANVGREASFGADSGAGWHRDAFVHFKVGNVGVVQKAVLRLFVVNGSTTGASVNLSRNPNWSEGSTAMPREAPFPIATVGAVLPSTWVEISMTNQVIAGGVLDLQLRARSEDAVAFASRESGAATAPQLVITSLPSPATPAAGLGAVVVADADASAVQTQASTNFGSEGVVFADHNSGLDQRLGFVRFPVAAARNGRTVTRATLRLWVTNASVGRVSILPFAEAAPNFWSESALTYERLPTFGLRTTMSPRVVQGVPQDHWLELDCTATAKDVESLSLQVATDTSDGLGFASREAADHRPELILEFEPVPCPAAGCGAGQTCVANVCVGTCAVSDDCSAGTVCAMGTCVPGARAASLAATHALTADDP